jgi:hypothetical protein
LADEALESFSISVPLIEFHEIQSRCSTSTEQDDSDHGNGNVKGTVDVKIGNNDNSDNGGEAEQAEKSNLEAQVTGSERDKKIVTPVHKLHPHVVTR